MGEACENLNGSWISRSRSTTRPSRSIPSYARAYVNRGDIYSKKGDRDRAIADYRKRARARTQNSGARAALDKLGVTP